jgi:hypothetical protein
MYTYTAYEQAVIGTIAPNPYLVHYFLWKYFLFVPFWFTPTFQEHNWSIKKGPCLLTFLMTTDTLIMFYIK